MWGYGAKLERAAIGWMLDLPSKEHGYTELMLPIIVKREVMEGSGNLPKFADNLYHDDEDDLWLVPTAEVPITNLHRTRCCRRDSAELLCRPDAMLPPGEGGGRPGYPGHQAGTPVQQGRDVQVR